MAKTKSSVSDVRAWAKEQGFDLADRGRLPAEVWAAWESRSAKPAARRAQSTTTSPPAASAADLAAALARIDQLEQQMVALSEALTALRQEQAEQPNDKPRRRFVKTRSRLQQAG